MECMRRKTAQQAMQPDAAAAAAAYAAAAAAAAYADDDIRLHVCRSVKPHVVNAVQTLQQGKTHVCN